MSPINEKQVEKILGSLPRFERDKKAERIFFEKLHGMAAEIEPTHGWFMWPRLAFVGSLTAFFILVSGTMWAYQSNVTRGHFLYPWKKSAERIELAYASSSRQKIDAHLRFSDRRLSEAENIISKNPSLAWLVPAARAHGDEIHLDTQEEIFLAETLTDMRSEVSQASEIVETAMDKIEEIHEALAKIEAITDKHIENLEGLEKRTSKNAKAIVRKIAQEEDDHLSAVLDAEEEIEEARIKKLERVQIKFLRREVKRQQRSQQAQEELQKTFELFESLPEEEQKDLTEKMERAKEALRSGKFGRVKGLSRALKNRIEKNEREPERTEKKEKKDEIRFKKQELRNEKVKSEIKSETKIKPEIKKEKITKALEEPDDFDAPVDPAKKMRLVDPEDVRELDDTEGIENWHRKNQPLELRSSLEESK